MLETYADVRQGMSDFSQIWTITGVAGFIGSHILNELLDLDQYVIGLDNFSTGKQENLDHVKSRVSEEQWNRFTEIRGDVSDLDACRSVVQYSDHILHLAALGSVPNSVDDPITAHNWNVTGFLNMLQAAREFHKKRIVYSSSSAVYGDEPSSQKTEDTTGSLLSPYAASKYIDEIYAETFANTYGMESIGLRYFNVFGPRQDPNGAYAAVIPAWIENMRNGKPCVINGDGMNTRDFIYVKDVVKANILASMTSNPDAVNQVYNVGSGKSVTLNELFGTIQDVVDPSEDVGPVYGPPRAGDIEHSLADISKIQHFLGFNPSTTFHVGMELTVEWFRSLG